MFPMCLTVLALVASEPSATPVAVAVVAPRDVSDSLVNRICAEAEAIWGSAGIAFECDRGTSTGKPPGLAIEVTIDDRRPPAGLEGALAWLTFAGGAPEHSIHLSRSSAEGLLRGTPGLIEGTITSRETLVGRALGRALAHEFGHYIFRSKLHTPRGLMRATWTSDQTFAVARSGFELTPQQRATAADCVRLEWASAPRV